MSFAAPPGARGYCLFGIESVTRPDGSLYPSTAAIAGSMRVLSALAGGMPRLCEKPMQAVGQEEYAVYQTLDFDGWTVMIRFTNPAPGLGRDDGDRNRQDYRRLDWQSRLFGALFAGKSPLEGKGAICYNVPVAGRSGERPAADAEIHTNIKEMQGYMKLGIGIQTPDSISSYFSTNTARA